MKYLPSSFCVRSLIVYAAVSVASAQDVPPPSAPVPDDEVLVLDPFVLNQAQDRGYVSRQATASGRVAQALENIPQSIVIVNAAMIEDMGVTSATDALRFVGGAGPNTDERNSTALNVRGFSVNSKRRNGASTGNGTFVLPEFTEQIEVVKGPAAVLYGASQPGGTVNVVTKNPRFKRETSITAQTYALGNMGGYSTSLDTTGPVPIWKDKNGNSRLAYRLVTVHERKNDFRMNDDRVERDGIFAKLTARLFEGLTIQTEFEKYQLMTNLPGGLPLAFSESLKSNPRDRVLPDTYLPVDWTSQSDNSRRYNYSKIWQNTITYTKNTARFGDWTARMFLTLENNFNYRELTVATGGNTLPRPVVQTNLNNVVNMDSRVTQADINAGRLWVPIRNVQKSVFNNGEELSSQWDITGRFETGPIKHTMLVGTEASWGGRNSRVVQGGGENTVLTAENYRSNGGRLLAVWVDAPNYSPIPVNWDDMRNASNPAGTVTQVIQGSTHTDSGFDAEVPWMDITPESYYFHDDLTFLQDRVVVSLGARHDEIEQTVLGETNSFNQWTYRYGAVLKLTKWVSLYGSHSESFTGNSEAAANDLGVVIPPQEGIQDEVGFRLSLWERRLGLTAAMFKLANTNLVIRNSFAPVGAPPAAFWTFIDSTEIHGFDIDATLDLTSETQLLMSYAYLDGSSTPTKEQAAADPGLVVLPLNQTARHQASAWGKWTARSGPMKGFSARVGYRWLSERSGGRLGFHADYWMPSYGIMDAGVGYKWKRFNFDLLVRNVLDEYAFRSSGGQFIIFQEPPRNAIFKVKYNF